MVGVLDTLRGQASLATQWAKGFLSDAVDTASRPSVGKLLKTAEEGFRAEYAAHWVPVIDDAVRNGLVLDKIVQQAYPRLKSNAAGFDPLAQKGAVALYQLLGRGDDGQKAFLGFCQRHKNYDAGLQIIEIALRNALDGNNESQIEMFSTPASKALVHSLIHGAESLQRETVVDAAMFKVLRGDLLRQLEKVGVNDPALALDTIK